MIRNIKYKLFFSIVLGLSVLVVYALRVSAQELPILANIFSNKEIRVVAIVSASPSPSPTPLWTMPEKIIQAQNLLKNMELKVGNTQIEYKESRFSAVGDKLVSSSKSFKEPEKEIALAVLDTATGEIKVIKIIKRGGDLIPPKGWSIDVLQRPNGIRWNGRNTAFQVNIPEHQVVIADVYPNETDTKVAQKKNGKTIYVTQRTIRYDLYSPYSPDLHSSELVKSGEDYTNTIIKKAFDDLRLAGVKSRAMSGTLVADLFASRSYFFKHIPLLEQTDLTEFQIDPKNTIDRANVLIGANQDQAFNITCNSSSACGWLQFTPNTYKTIVKYYPAAKLIKDFKNGASDHVNSMKAAILLYDENLKGLFRTSGQQILSDPKLEEYLAASYNGAPRHAYASLKAAILGGIKDWIDAVGPQKAGLRTETKGYLVKLRYLQQQDNPSLTSISK
ncbi:MAG: hypothetical protein AAB638_01990 [Patescibacteria group bacterium]